MWSLAQRGCPHPGRAGSKWHFEAYLRGAGTLRRPQHHALSQGPVYGLLCQLLKLFLILQDAPPAGGHPNLWRQEGLVTEGLGLSSHWKVATSILWDLTGSRGGAIVAGNILLPLPPCTQNKLTQYFHGYSSSLWILSNNGIILTVRKQRFREEKWLALGNGRSSWCLSPGLWTSWPKLLNGDRGANAICDW